MVKRTRGWCGGRIGLWVLLASSNTLVAACSSPGSTEDPDAATGDLGGDGSALDLGDDLGVDLPDASVGDQGASDSGTDAGPPIDCVIAQLMGSRSDSPATLMDLLSIRTCAGVPLTGLSAAELEVQQDGTTLGVDAAHHLDSRPRSVVRLVHFLVDTSAAADRTAAVASIRVALNALQGSGNPDRNYVALSLFAGQAGVVSGVPTLDYDTLDAELTALATYVPPDTGASNLNEALVEHVAASLSSREAIAARSEGGAFSVGYTIVVTSRGDSAGRATDQAAADAIEMSGEQVFFATPGIFAAAERTRLESIANRDVRDAASTGADGVGHATNQVRNEIGALYVSSLCSPARAGMHALTFRAALGIPFQEAPSRMFDATGFAGGCGSTFLELACQNRECGGLLCGACDDRLGACDAQSGTCASFCQPNACRGEVITNQLGYSQVCGERGGARVCRDVGSYCFPIGLNEPCPCVPEVISGVQDPACPSGTTCYPDVLGEPNWGGRCLTTGVAQVDEVCEDITDCAPGLACGVDARACRLYGVGCAERRCRPLAEPETETCPAGQVSVAASTAYFVGGERTSLTSLWSIFGRTYAWCEDPGVACESDAQCDAMSRCATSLCLSRAQVTQCVVDDSATGGYRCPEGSECVEYLDYPIGLPGPVTTGRICAPSCSCSGTTCCDGVTASGFPTVCSAARVDDGFVDAFPVRGLTTGGDGFCIPARFATALATESHPMVYCTASASAGTNCGTVSGPQCSSGLTCVDGGGALPFGSCLFSSPPRGRGCVYTTDYFLECTAAESQTGLPDPRCLAGTSCYASSSGPPRCYRTGGGLASASCSADADCAPSLVCAVGQCAAPTP